jgi:hypothetical protein
MYASSSFYTKQCIEGAPMMPFILRFLAENNVSVNGTSKIEEECFIVEYDLTVAFIMVDPSARLKLISRYKRMRDMLKLFKDCIDVQTFVNILCSPICVGVKASIFTAHTSLYNSNGVYMTESVGQPYQPSIYGGYYEDMWWYTYALTDPSRINGNISCGEIHNMMEAGIVTLSDCIISFSKYPNEGMYTYLRLCGCIFRHPNIDTFPTLSAHNLMEYITHSNIASEMHTQIANTMSKTKWDISHVASLNYLINQNVISKDMIVNSMRYVAPSPGDSNYGRMRWTRINRLH